MAHHDLSAESECSAPIRLVNTLHDIFASADVPNPLDIPQIAVIGTSRSEKNSVLEGLVRRNFIPKILACDMKIPLILQLINQPHSKQEEANSHTKIRGDLCEWGEFLHLPGQKFYDFDQIRQVIEECSSATAFDRAIFSTSITLKIYSSYVSTLTLVDLPNVSQAGASKEPTGVEEQIRKVVLDQITKSRTIILAVTSRTTYITDSPSVKIANEVDPDAQRTIEILSEAEKVDDITNLPDTLAGKLYLSQNGCVPMVSRRRESVGKIGEKCVSSESEGDVFQTHHAYRSKALRGGIDYLATTLHTFLEAHIKRHLPYLKKEISTTLAEYTAELDFPSRDAIQGSGTEVVLTYMTKFNNDYRTAVNNSLKSTLTQTGIGGKLSRIFHDDYRIKIETIDLSAYFSDVDIRSLLYCCSGSHSEDLAGTAVFEIMARTLVKKLEDPSIQCLLLVHEEMVRTMEQLLRKPAFRRLPELGERIYRVVLEFHKRTLEPTSALVHDLVAMEACYVNIHHPDFLDGQDAVALVRGRHNHKERAEDRLSGKEAEKSKGCAETQSNEARTSKESMNLDVEVVKLLLASHFSIIRQALMDLVPKAIVLKFVDHTVDNILKELLEHIYHSPQFEGLIKETEDALRSNKSYEKMIGCLEKASQMIAFVDT